MIELYLSKRDPQSQTEEEGKLYARVSYKESMNVQDVATHMASHNTIYSEGTIVGVMTDFVRCVRHLILEGKTVGHGRGQRADRALRCRHGQGGLGHAGYAGCRCQDGCRSEGGEAAGPGYRRGDARRAEEECEAHMDGQDQGRDCCR